MELDPVYTFVPLPPRHYMGIENKVTQDYFKKWGLAGNISVQDFCFNEPFQPYNKYHLAEQFFYDSKVANHLLHQVGDSWTTKGIKATSVEINPVPCTVLNTSFFDKLTDPENKVVGFTGNIRQRCDLDVDGFIVSDNLRGMLLDEECDQYSLYGREEREEFIFRIFELLVLGGSLCQYEERLQPYIEVTRRIYKELVRVHKKQQDGDLSIGTTVVEVTAKDSQGNAFFPSDPEHRQNVGFLLIDGNGRQVTTLLHQFGTFHW